MTEDQKSLKDFQTSKKVAKRPTYSQNWPAYDFAKTNEVTLFRQLLQELLDASLPEDNSQHYGRKRILLKVRIFCICMKIYYRADLRKCVSILREFQRLGYIEKVPSYRSIDYFLNDESLA